MKGVLFDDFSVELDARTLEIGGAFPVGETVAWDPALIAFFYRELQKFENPIVLDIGASTGSFALLAKFHPGAFIHAFEPNPFAYEILATNIRLNGLEDRVEALRVAVFSDDGKAVLKVPKVPQLAGLACLGQPSKFARWREYNVQTRRLDSYPWPNGVDVIKIDVEGAELAVLEGGEVLIKDNMPSILLEASSERSLQLGRDSKEAWELLKSWGYINFIEVGIGGEDLWATT